jgi:hypothetical protein
VLESKDLNANVKLSLLALLIRGNSSGKKSRNGEKRFIDDEFPILCALSGAAVGLSMTLRPMMDEVIVGTIGYPRQYSSHTFDNRETTSSMGVATHQVGFTLNKRKF